MDNLASRDRAHEPNDEAYEKYSDEYITIARGKKFEAKEFKTATFNEEKRV